MASRAVHLEQNLQSLLDSQEYRFGMNGLLKIEKTNIMHFLTEQISILSGPKVDPPLFKLHKISNQQTFKMGISH